MIEIKTLTKNFGSFSALDQISFDVEKGSVFGLVGSNGAGKSTLLRTLSGIYMPDGGEVLIDGEHPFENISIKNKVVFIPDYPYFLPQSNLEQMAKLYRSIYENWSEETYRKLCSTFPISQSQRISAMSKGMQRQAALILALSAKPDYLLLDEIFDGLDPVIRQLLKQLLSSEVFDRQMTVVIASHNLRELEDLCDHIGLLHKGGILFEQDLDSLKLGIHKIQAVFQPMPELTELKAVFEMVSCDTQGSMIRFVAKGNREGILKKLELFHPVFSEIIPLSLEEVFISEMEAAGYDLENILN